LPIHADSPLGAVAGAATDLAVIGGGRSSDLLADTQTCAGAAVTAFGAAYVAFFDLGLGLAGPLAGAIAAAGGTSGVFAAAGVAALAAMAASARTVTSP
jgi:hypothetical protein